MEEIRDLVELDERQAGKLAGVKPLTMNKWRYRGKGPAFYRLGGKIKYKRSDVLTWIESCRVDPKQQKQKKHKKARA